MVKNKISGLSKILLAITSALLIISIFVPLWRIELNAPQYPEGLALLIYTFKLGGNVDIINGLNHYIGMKTLHAKDFIEFTILPYIIGFFALWALFTSISGGKKMLNILFFAFLSFGIVAMIDFWRWEYNYGHDLNPEAAIIVPGMAYQPPLIGFKQLLNFGAYSIPDAGGWLFIAAGLILLFCVVKESAFYSTYQLRKSTMAVAVLLPILLSSCSQAGPEPIKLNADNCDYCKMTIADGRFGCELITQKGRTYKFDDILCMINYKKENDASIVRSFYVCDFTKQNVLVPAENAWYVNSEKIGSPMGGNIAAFASKDSAEFFASTHNSKVEVWNDLLQ